MQIFRNIRVDFTDTRTCHVPAFVFALFTMLVGPVLPIAAAEQAAQLGQAHSIASDVRRAAPADLLDEIFSYDADTNTASWLGFGIRNIVVAEIPGSQREPYQVTLDADLFDGDQSVATLSSTNTWDRMAFSITTADAIFDQTVEHYDSTHLMVISSLAFGDTSAENPLTLTQIVDISTGEVVVRGRASQDDFWGAVAASIGFPSLDGGGRACATAWVCVGGAGALAVVAVICVISWYFTLGWCW